MSFVNNTGKHIQHIMSQTSCKKHKASPDMPCFWMESSSDETHILHGVCGRRAKKAGFTGKISPQSLSSSKR